MTPGNEQQMMRPLSLLAGVAAFYLTAAQCSESKLVFSESFDDGRARWRSVGTGTIDAVRRHSGKACLRICDDNDGKYFSTSTSVPIKPSSQYEITFSAFTKDSRHGGLTVIVYDVKRDVKTRIVHFHFPFAGSESMGVWRTTKRTFVTGPTSAHCDLRLNPANGNRAYTGTMWFDDISLRYVGPAPKPVRDERLQPLPTTPPAEDRLPLRPLPPLALDLASPDCTICCPALPELTAAAEELASAVEKCAGRRPRLVDDAVDVATLGRGPVLVMGNLVTSALGRKLYLTGYDFTDYAWPGKGGHVLRTIRDPFGTGAHVLMVGGSYPEDIGVAARAAGEMTRNRGPRLSYMNVVKLGLNADAIRGWTEKYKSADPKLWDHLGPLGSWTYLEQIGKAAMGFLRTGEEEYLRHFKRELLYYFEHNVYDWKKYHEGRLPSSHSAIDMIVVPWDLLADHPFFSAEERRQIDEKFLFLACGPEGPRAFRRTRWGLHSNHALGKALDGYWLGRDFLRRYGIEEGRRWMIMAGNVFAGLMVSAKPYEDNNSHQFNASLLAGIIYACAAGREDYFESRALREAAERFLMIYMRGYHAVYMAATAVVTNDPTYLSLEVGSSSEAYVRQCAAMARTHCLGENLRSFCGFTEPKVRKNLIGVHVAPLEPNWYQVKAKGTQRPHSLFRFTTPADKCFDKATIRDGFGAKDFILMVDGLSGGLHSFQDAGCITRYQDRGYNWFRADSHLSTPPAATVRGENGMFVGLDGCGPEAVHFAARLLYASRIDDRHDALGTALEGIGHIDWRRHILRKRGAWTLVVDQAAAGKGGEAFLERNWYLRSMDNTAVPDGVHSRHGDYCLHLQSVGLPPGNMTGAKNRRELLRVRVEAGQTVEIAALLHTNTSPTERTFVLARTAEGWRISGPDAMVGVTLTDRGLRTEPATSEIREPPRTLPLLPSAPEMDLGWKRVRIADTPVTAVATAPSRLAAGARDGTVGVVGFDGKILWQAQLKSEVLSLHFCGDNLLTGEDNGTISRFDADGQLQWSVTIPYVKMSYPHWSDKRSRIHEISSADMDGDGRDEILLANGDRRIYAYTPDGRQIWKAVVKYGIYNAMTPGTHSGKFALFGGAREPTLEGPFLMFGADGKEIGRLRALRQESQRIRDVRRWDTDGDGTLEIVAARDLDGKQLTVCNGKTREPIWLGNVGGTPYGLAVREHGGERQILCASTCGYLHAFNASTGERRWWCYLGDDARFLWSRPDGSVLALCPSGRVFVISPSGELRGMQALGSRVTALLRPGEHRVAPTAIPVGTQDGWLRYLPLTN